MRHDRVARAADRQGNGAARHRPEQPRSREAQPPDDWGPDLRDAPASPNKWTGAIYNAKDGKTYSGNIELLGLNALKIEGCLGPFCDHEIWGRTN